MWMQVTVRPEAGGRLRRLVFASALSACLAVASGPHAAAADDVDAVYDDIVQTYGTMPGFFRLFARGDAPELWDAFKALQLNPDLGIDARTRELIGVAVATEGDCPLCLYFHAAAALANGASEQEIRAAVGVGAATRRLDAALSTARGDAHELKRETDLVLWGDTRTIELRGPSPDLCGFILAGTDAADAGC